MIIVNEKIRNKQTFLHVGKKIINSVAVQHGTQIGLGNIVFATGNLQQATFRKQSIDKTKRTASNAPF
jgi:hypothetical protein